MKIICPPSDWLHKSNRPIQKPFKSRVKKQISSISLKQHLTTHDRRYIGKSTTKGVIILRILHIVRAHTQLLTLHELSFHKNVIVNLGLKSILSCEKENA